MRIPARKLLRAPLFWILVFAAAMRVAGLFWGLPHADGWDDDGFAPRNFLTALALTWTPGSYFTYPPLHAFVLLPLTLPGAVIALAQAPSLSQADVIAAITQPFYMTWFSLAARLVGIAMSLGIIWAIGRMAELAAGRRAGLLAAGACALGVGLTYYGQVSNLDVPYLFWSSLSLLALMRAMVERQTRRLWHAALLAAAAIATKDQAYAVFALGLPAALLLWFAADAWPRAHARRVLAALGGAALLAGFLLLLVDGAITNPSGFAKRVAFLAGPASHDYAAYVAGPSGWWALLCDMATHFAQGSGMVVLMLAALGAAWHLRDRRDAARWVAGMLPLLAILSFTLCFNFAALRSDDRFLLPQAVFASVYVGIAAARLLDFAPARRPMQVALAVLALFAAYACASVPAAMRNDPRYDMEAWMRVHLRPGDMIETYGQNFYLPRFPEDARTSRVGQGALKVRNPLPNVTELLAPFEAVEQRRPRYILVADRWARRYLTSDAPPGTGRVHPENQRGWFAETGARAYFAALYQGRTRYRQVHVAAPRSAPWQEVHIHESLNETVRIFERMP